MIGILSYKIAAAIKAKVPEHPASIEVLKYSISAILNIIFIVILSLLVSILLGKVTAALTVLIAFALLRQLSGGVHLKSGILCVLVTTALVTVLSFASMSDNLTYGTTFAAVIIAFLYAPSRIEQQTRIKPKYFPLLKWLSVILIATNFLIVSPVIAATFLFQTLTLIRERR
jgi:accessory gene regulator B